MKIFKIHLSLGKTIYKFFINFFPFFFIIISKHKDYKWIFLACEELDLISRKRGDAAKNVMKYFVIIF